MAPLSSLTHKHAGDLQTADDDLEVWQTGTGAKEERLVDYGAHLAPRGAAQAKQEGSQR